MSEPATEPREVGITHPANLLTLTRLVFAPLLFWFVLDADANGGVLGGVRSRHRLAVTDFFDGRVARRSNVVSRSGAFLDPLADKIVVIGGAYCLVYVERYWWVPVTIIALRELGITAYRSRWAREGLALPARTSAKYKTFVQGVALILAVMPTLQDQDVVVDAALWVAVGWTVFTGVQYLLDGQTALSETGH